MIENIKSYKDLETAFLAQDKFLSASDQEIKNYKYALNKWKESFAAESDSKVGEELSGNFRVSLEFFTQKQLESEISPSTFGPIISRLRKIRDFFQFNLPPQLPRNFYDRLRTLSKANNKSLALVYQHLNGTISYSKLRRWGLNGCFPSIEHIPLIHEIEKILGVREGILLDTLPAPKITVENLKKNTKHGLKLSKCCSNPYGIKIPLVEEEIDKFIEYKVAPIPPQNLERNEAWTEDSEGKVSSAEAFKSTVRRILGYACLPVENDNLMLRGLGMDKDDLTLGLLAKSEVVIPFVRDFLFTRSGKKYNNGHILIISRITPILREKTGYLYQKYEFSNKLGLNLSEEDWHKLCLKTRNELINLRRQLEKLRSAGSSSFERGRDPEEKISEILRSPNPLNVSVNMLKSMLEDISKLERSPRQQAELFRDIALTAVAQVVPFRTSMFAKMRMGKNLIRHADGLWTLVFDRLDFKNRRFLTNEFRHTLSRQVSLILDQYVEVYRLRLGGAETSDLFFPPLKSKEQPLSPSDISNIMARRSAQYVENCKGFRIHSCRHIFVTDVIKQFGRNGVDIAAAALNDNPRTIERHYAHLLNSDYEHKINSHIDRNWGNAGIDKMLGDGGTDQ